MNNELLLKVDRKDGTPKYRIKEADGYLGPYHIHFYDYGRIVRVSRDGERFLTRASSYSEIVDYIKEVRDSGDTRKHEELHRWLDKKWDEWNKTMADIRKGKYAKLGVLYNDS